MDKTIPHRVFYVWFGDKRPVAVEMCIRNWKQILPTDWEIIEVGDKPSPWFDFHAELEKSSWLRTVYERKMWAYVSDYVRCKVLYDHGGVYLDTDVTLEKDLSPLLGNSLFLGWEHPDSIAMGICGAPPKHELMGAMMDFYQNDIWHEPIFTIPSILTHLLKKRFGNQVKYGAEILHLPGVTLYPEEYFYPWKHRSRYSESCLTENSYCIHWWGESWVNPDFDYFLRNKHIPGFDYGAPMGTQLTTEYRLGPVRLVVTKKKEKFQCCYLLGFLPFFCFVDCGDKIKLFGFIPFSIKTKEKHYLLKSKR